MSVYAIGDIQGCYQELLALLNKIAFDPARDQVWFTGDLVNRGPQSLETLRYVKSLGDSAITVLGNHDLHLLAIAAGYAKTNDSLTAILNAPDRQELLDWLRHRPVLHHDTTLGYTLVHAGIPAEWTPQTARAAASEIEQTLRGNDWKPFLQNMYGDQPDRWSDQLAGIDRLRYITNAFTRMRYCGPQGQLEFSQKGPPGTQAPGWVPWFNLDNRQHQSHKIIFGHWSTLGLSDSFSTYGIDTGCLWGGQLTAMQLDSTPPVFTQQDRLESTSP